MFVERFLLVNLTRSLLLVATKLILVDSEPQAQGTDLAALTPAGRTKSMPRDEASATIAGASTGELKAPWETLPLTHQLFGGDFASHALPYVSTTPPKNSAISREIHSHPELVEWSFPNLQFFVFGDLLGSSITHSFRQYQVSSTQPPTPTEAMFQVKQPRMGGSIPFHPVAKQSSKA